MNGFKCVLPPLFLFMVAVISVGSLAEPVHMPVYQLLGNTPVYGLKDVNKVPEGYIVVLKKDTGLFNTRASISNYAEKLANRVGGKIRHVYDSALTGFSMSLGPEAVALLAAESAVDYIEAIGYSSVFLTENNGPRNRYLPLMPTNTLVPITQTPTTNWGIDRIDQVDLPLTDSYTYSYDGSGVHMYILDTGTNSSHVEFQGRLSMDLDVMPDSDTQRGEDCYGHGTHVMGIASGTRYGVAKKTSIHNLRVLGCDGSGPNDGIVRAIDWVIANAIRPAIINMSLTDTDTAAGRAMTEAANRAVSNGIFVSVAAGNSGLEKCEAPSNATKAFAVGMTTRSDRRSSGSNYGACLDMFAPGDNIGSASYTSPQDRSTVYMTGTSMAAPHVAGVAALYWQEFPSYNVEQIKQLMIENSLKGKVTDGRTSPNRLVYMGGSSGPGPDPLTELKNDVPVTVSGKRGDEKFYIFKVPSSATKLSFEMSGGTGNANLYIKFGSKPSTKDYDCRSETNSNNEVCSITNIRAGTYYVLVDGYSDYSNAQLKATYTGDTGPLPNELKNNVPVTVSANYGEQKRYTMKVPANALFLSFKVSGGTGDADLYVRYGSEPTTSVYDCASEQWGNFETCTIFNVQGGVYHVMLNAYDSFSNAELVGSYN